MMRSYASSITILNFLLSFCDAWRPSLRTTTEPSAHSISPSASTESRASHDNTEVAAGQEEVQKLLSSLASKGAFSTPHDGADLLFIDRQDPAGSSSSCFASALPPSSSPCESLSSTESDALRIETAAKMAVCEISTSPSRSIPRECQDFGESGVVDWSGCVEALSRSPQYWSSYSGYLREIVTLCSAYRRWADLDRARELHGSTANRLADFVGQIQELERARFRASEEEAILRAALIRELPITLLSKFEPLASSLVLEMQSHINELEQVLSTFKSATNSFEPTLRDLISRGSAEMQAELKRSSDQHGQELRVLTARISDESSDRLQGMALSVETAIERSLGGLRSQASDLSEALMSIALAADSSVSALGRVERGILGVSEATGQIQLSLATSLDLADQSQKRHKEMNSDVHDQLGALSAAVSNLTSRVQSTSLGSSSLIGALAGTLRLEPSWWLLGSLNSLFRFGLSPYSLMLACAALVVGFDPVKWWPSLALLAVTVLLYPFFVRVLRCARWLRRRRSHKTTTEPLPPSLASLRALEATQFALLHPPSYHRAGLGAFNRPRRAPYYIQPHYRPMFVPASDQSPALLGRQEEGLPMV